MVNDGDGPDRIFTTPGILAGAGEAREILVENNQMHCIDDAVLV